VILPAKDPRSTARSPRLGTLELALTAVVAAALLSSAVGSAAPPASALRAAARPIAPQKYKLPRPAIWVSNAAQLRSALTRYTSRNIILRNGYYGSTVPYSNQGGDRLYAQMLGKAVVGAGMIMGGNSGPGGGVIQGVAFDVNDDSKTLQDSIIHVWGSGKNTRIVDVTLEGHGVVGAGIKARQAEGLTVRRVVARHFQSWGVIVDENKPDAQISHPPLVTDIQVSYVSRPVPKSSDGRAEACVWIGNTAVVRRIRAHHCAWDGLWAGTAAHHAVFEDVRVTDSYVGVYVEHFAYSSTFRRLQIGPSVDSGLICEWADPGWGSRPACVGNVIEDSTFDTRFFGVYLDKGTTGTTVRDSTFFNQCWTAIGDYAGYNNLYDTTGNDYRGLPAGAVPISRQHYSDSPCAQPSQG
jgi:hypothetical protein